MALKPLSKHDAYTDPFYIGTRDRAHLGT